MSKAGANFCPTLCKPSHNGLRLLKYCQNCEISPNLVTLIPTYGWDWPLNLTSFKGLDDSLTWYKLFSNKTVLHCPTLIFKIHKMDIFIFGLHPYLGKG